MTNCTFKRGSIGGGFFSDAMPFRSNINNLFAAASFRLINVTTDSAFNSSGVRRWVDIDIVRSSGASLSLSRSPSVQVPSFSLSPRLESGSFPVGTRDDFWSLPLLSFLALFVSPVTSSCCIRCCSCCCCCCCCCCVILFSAAIFSAAAATAGAAEPDLTAVVVVAVAP